jgi:hypothetical protein
LDKENIELISKYENNGLVQTEVPTVKQTSKSNNVSTQYVMKLNLSSGYTISINLNERLNEELLWLLTEDKLSYVRNGYYAKHGYRFSMEKYLNYFNQYLWYNPVGSNVESSLTNIDEQNIKLVQSYEALFDSNQQQNIYVGYFYIYFDRGGADYIIIDLEQKLDESILWQLSSTELALLRNAYYAKNGYIFTKQEYTNYFYQCEWYYPDKKNVESRLTNQDKNNIVLVQKYE